MTPLFSLLFQSSPSDPSPVSCPMRLYGTMVFPLRVLWNASKASGVAPPSEWTKRVTGAGLSTLCAALSVTGCTYTSKGLKGQAQEIAKEPKRRPAHSCEGPAICKSSYHWFHPKEKKKMYKAKNERQNWQWPYSTHTKFAKRSDSSFFFSLFTRTVHALSFVVAVSAFFFCAIMGRQFSSRAVSTVCLSAWRISLHGTSTVSQVLLLK